MRTSLLRGKFVALIAAPLALCLASCGASSTSSGNAGSLPVAGTTVATTAACPDMTKNVTWPTVASTQISATQSSVSATVGERIEVVLPVTARWRFSPASGGSVLQLQQPAGYFDAVRQSCVWRFVAVAKGQTTLVYAKTALCVPGTKCSQVALALPIDITVT
ncbi:MAG: hypothetical protein H0X24_04770 [Ktedonobacterales bacterium]|nr:hypothetical protein [Ktedonobacterales bacterium]